LALGLAMPAAQARELPLFLDIPAALAATHPDLVTRRANLVQARDALRNRTANHNAECDNVEVGSAQESSCIAARATLAADIDRHAEASDAFNADVRRAKSICVRGYGYDLVFALRDCEQNQPSAFSYACLSGTGISERSLFCLPAVRTPTEETFAACGIILSTIPLDALIRCKDINNVCITAALQTHKERTSTCLR